MNADGITSDTVSNNACLQAEALAHLKGERTVLSAGVESKKRAGVPALL
jgi:hypothetical protein